MMTFPIYGMSKTCSKPPSRWFLPAPPFSDPYFDGEHAEKSPEASCGMSNFLSPLSGGSASSKGADESAGSHGSDGFQGESPVKRTQTNQTNWKFLI